MSPDEWTYAFILITSVVFGQILRFVDGAGKKKILSSAVGITIVVATCGWKSLMSAISIVINSCIVKFLPARYEKGYMGGQI